MRGKFVKGVYRQPATTLLTILQNGQDKTPKVCPKKRSSMEHSPGLPQHTKSLRSCISIFLNLRIKQ